MARKKINIYKDNGIKLTPCTLTVGKNIKLTYSGLLVKCGAQEVYARIGYGSTFNNMNDWKMNRSRSGFELMFPIEQSENVYVCFRDSLNNWDNNSGNNYVFSISKKSDSIKEQS